MTGINLLSDEEIEVATKQSGINLLEEPQSTEAERDERGFVEGFNQVSIRDASINLKAGGLLFESMLNITEKGRQINKTFNQADKYEKWRPLIWDAEDNLNSIKDKTSPQYQEAYEELAKVKENFTLDMAGKYVPESQDFNFSDFVDQVKSNPSFFAGSITKAILADPALLLVPGGAAKMGNVALNAAKVAKAGSVVKTVAKASGQAIGVTGMTVGLGVTARAVIHADENPDAPINMDEIIEGVKFDTKLGLVLGLVPAGFTGFSLANRYRAASKWKASKQVSTTNENGLVRDAEDIAGNLSEIFGVTVNKAKTQTKAELRALESARKAELKGQIDELTVSKTDVDDIFSIASITAKELKTKKDVETLFTAAMQSGNLKRNAHVPEPVEIQPTHSKMNKQIHEKTETDLAFEKHEAVLAREINNGFEKMEAHAKIEQTVENQFKARMESMFGPDKPNSIFRDAMEKAGIYLDGIIEPDQTQVAAANILKNQRGSIKPKQLFALTAIAGAGLLGYGEEGDIGNGVATAILTAGGLTAGVLLAHAAKKSVNAIKNTDFLEKREFTMMPFIDRYDARESAITTATIRFNEHLRLMLNKQELTEVAPYIQGTLTDVSDNVKIAAQHQGQWFDSIFALAKEHGVINSYVENFIPGMYRQKDVAGVAAFFAGKGFGQGTGTRHNKQKFYQTIEDAKAAGFVPITENIAEINALYSRSVGTAINNKVAVQELKNMTDPRGLPLLARAKDIPGGMIDEYTEINNPSLRVGKRSEELLRIHKQVADSVKLIFDNPSSVPEPLLLINMILKRNLVSASLFHAKALIESSAMSMGLLKGLGSNASLLKEFRKRGSHPALEQLYYGHAGDEVDLMMRAGLKISKIDDVGGDKFKVILDGFDNQMMNAGILGKTISFAAVKPYKALTEAIDTVMWDKIMTANKLVAAMDNFKAMKQKNIKLNQKNPEQFPLIPDDVLRVQAAALTNDAFGGLNWRRLAESAQSKLGHAIASRAFSQTGRDWMQIGMFAPDWTLANIRIIGKAAPNLKDNPLRPKTAEALQKQRHQYYALRGIMYFLAGQEALNQMVNGNHYPGFDAMGITDKKYDWEKGKAEHYKDLYHLYIGDGDYMQLTKQLIEPPKWVFSPKVELSNKLGILPKMIEEIRFGKEYINAQNQQFSPDIVEEGENAPLEYSKYLLSKGIPISLGQYKTKNFEDGGWDLDVLKGISGSLGFPIYRGKEYEE